MLIEWWFNRIIRENIEIPKIHEYLVVSWASMLNACLFRLLIFTHFL